jgi:hypothetical protein
VSYQTNPTYQDQDTGPRTGRRKSLDFENDITSRLASLRGLGSGVNFDSFGLPTAPTFRPEDRSATVAASLVRPRGGYTDEDQKTWCIVCLDDAAIRCVGCDNDVYCSRCFKEMVFSPLFFSYESNVFFTLNLWWSLSSDWASSAHTSATLLCMSWQSG